MGSLEMRSKNGPLKRSRPNGWFIPPSNTTLWPCDVLGTIYIYCIYIYSYESTSEHVWRLLTWLAKTDCGGDLHWMAKIYSFLSVSVCTNADTRDWARRAVGRSKAEYILATHQFSFIRPGFFAESEDSWWEISIIIAGKRLHSYGKSAFYSWEN